MYSSKSDKNSEIIKTPKDLARELAVITTSIRIKIEAYLHIDGLNSTITQIYSKMKKLHFNDLTVESFSDMYAQTIIYGFIALLAASPDKKDIKNYLKKSSETIPILKDFIKEYFNSSEEKRLNKNNDGFTIDELFHLFNKIDMNAIIRKFNENKTLNESKDFVIHFYEEFLQEYHPENKISSGVFYTPDAVVSFIIRSINALLQSEFKCNKGLLNNIVQTPKSTNKFKINVFDPAVGTGTFLLHFIEEIFKLFRKEFIGLNEDRLRQKWNDYVKSVLLNQINGFELYLTPYIITHLKIRLKLAETGYELSDTDQIGVLLANTLMENQSIKPITIIIGNPPYKGHSATNSQWMDDLLHGREIDETRKSSYFEIDGNPLDEKNPKWLNDDYVKFIRFAQWRIEKTGYGIVALVTPHSFLDNPTFRGMRQQLMTSFSDIYVLDLHGNTRSKEKAPDGRKDENIFDIQQGICISFFIKNPNKHSDTRIYRSDLWGLRKEKFDFLNKNDISTIQWKKIKAFSPWYMFYHLSMKRWAEYNAGWSILDIFSHHSVGIMTGQDHLTIKKSPNEVQEVIEDFIKLPESKFKQKHNLKDIKRQWSYIKAKKDIKACGLTFSNTKTFSPTIKSKIVPILYRPFDIRFTFYTGRSRGFHERPRGDVMKHLLLGQNLGLIVSRNSKPSSWRDVQITENIIELGVMATRPGNNAPIFPLYRYVQTSTGLIKETNFTQKFKTYINDNYEHDKQFKAKIIPYYIFAILNSQEYRNRYEEFLKIDFPRIPIVKNKDLFFKIAKIGEELANIHLLRFEKTAFDTSKVSLHQGNMKDSLIVKKVKFLDKNRLWINNQTYFAGISRDVYEYYIGSYKICQKWLKRFKNYTLSKTEVNTFINIVWVIEQTLQLSKEIDILIDTHGGWESDF